jgi:putative transposase
MPRKLRMEYPGAIYHVLNRGDRRVDIFCDERDRERFLAALAEACAKSNWQVLASCLKSAKHTFMSIVRTCSLNRL